MTSEPAVSVVCSIDLSVAAFSPDRYRTMEFPGFQPACPIISAITAVQSIVRVPLLVVTLPVALAVVGLVPPSPADAFASFAPRNTTLNAVAGPGHMYGSVNIAEVMEEGLLAGLKVVLHPP